MKLPGDHEHLRKADLSGALVVAELRKDFPIFEREVHGRPLAYLDSASTSQKPRQVIDAVGDFYRFDNANVHRGLHSLSARATFVYESARNTVRNYINAADVREVVFVRGATEAINLVAWSYGKSVLKPGDEVLVSIMEHHSNLLPWAALCRQCGALMRYVDVNDDGELDLADFERKLTARTKLLCIAHISNTLGTVNPIVRIVRDAHQVGAKVLVDGAQAVGHIDVDVRDLDCDFYVFSGHKAYGPSGIGVLYAKAELLEEMPPWHLGGEMVVSVDLDEGPVFADAPYKFEAGTPNIAGAAGLGAALSYLGALDSREIRAYERGLFVRAGQALRSVPGLRLIGEAEDKAVSHSFVLDGIHPHDVATVADHHGVAIRSGHHCAQPLMKRFGLSASLRASFALYNSDRDVEQLLESLYEARKLFS